MRDPHARRYVVGGLTRWRPSAAGMRPVRKASQKDLYEWLHAIADKAKPEVMAALLAAIDKLKAMPLKQIEDAIASGNVASVLGALGIEETLARELGADFAASITATAATAATAAAQTTMPAAYALGYRFDLTNPYALQHIADYRFNLIRQISAETRDGVRQIVQDAFEIGGHPYEQARYIRKLIGLTSNQAKAVANFRAALLQGEFAMALDRRLRDRRFDASLLGAMQGKKKLSAEKIERMVQRYYERALKMRAETIARTETIRASHVGVHASQKQAMALGYIDADTTRRHWLVTPDDRLCPYCRAIPKRNPDGVLMDETFESGLGPVQYPPAHPDCRCTYVLEFTDDE